MVCRLLVIRHDEDAPLITKLILVRAFSDHSPGETRVGGQEGIAILCGASAAWTDPILINSP
jgi:hypothetical protein